MPLARLAGAHRVSQPLLEAVGGGLGALTAGLWISLLGENRGASVEETTMGKQRGRVETAAAGWRSRQRRRAAVVVGPRGDSGHRM